MKRHFQWIVCGTIGMLFVGISLTAQAGESGKSYLIYDNGQIHKSVKPNVYIDSKGIPTLVINRKKTAMYRYRRRSVTRTRAPSVGTDKHQTNKTMEALLNSAAGLIKKPQPTAEDPALKKLKLKQQNANSISKSAAVSSPDKIENGSGDGQLQANK